MSELRTIVGIDVGENGGIAVLYTDDTIQVFKMPDNGKARAELLGMFSHLDPIVFIEHQQMQPRDLVGGRWNNVQNLLINYGGLLEEIERLGYDYCKVSPRKWQNGLFKDEIKEIKDYQERKHFFRDKASEMSNIKATLWSADAILIAIWGKMALVKDKKYIKKNLIINSKLI